MKSKGRIELGWRVGWGGGEWGGGAGCGGGGGCTSCCPLCVCIYTDINHVLVFTKQNNNGKEKNTFSPHTDLTSICRFGVNSVVLAAPIALHQFNLLSFILVVNTITRTGDRTRALLFGHSWYRCTGLGCNTGKT